MELTGLDTLQPSEETRIVRLSKMVGDAFVNEAWTATVLDNMPSTSTGEDRRRFLSEAIIMNDLAIGTPWGMGFANPEDTIFGLAYQKSELHGMTWERLKEQAAADMIQTILSIEEAEALMDEMARLKDVTNFKWAEEDAGRGDYIHILLLAVDPAEQGKGLFFKLIQPFLDYADAHKLPIYLDAYQDDLVELYRRFDFEIVGELRSPDTPLVQRCMKRLPHIA